MRVLLLNYYPKGPIWWRFVAPAIKTHRCWAQFSYIAAVVFLVTENDGEAVAVPSHCKVCLSSWASSKKWRFKICESEKLHMQTMKLWWDLSTWFGIIWFILCFLPFQKMLRHFPTWRKPSPLRSLQSGGWHHRHRRAAHWKDFPRCILLGDSCNGRCCSGTRCLYW